jgi:hypothetical protein
MGALHSCTLDRGEESGAPPHQPASWAGRCRGSQGLRLQRAAADPWAGSIRAARRAYWRGGDAAGRRQDGTGLAAAVRRRGGAAVGQAMLDLLKRNGVP